MQESRITEKTWVPMGIAVSAIIAFCGGAVWLNSNMLKIQLRLDSIEDRMSRSEGSWLARGEFVVWTKMLEAQNAELRVPPPPFKE